MDICTTGFSGSLASSLPQNVLSLETRLECPTQDMVIELQGIRRKPDVLIHSAALVSPQLCEKKPNLAYELNVGGTERWFRAACELSIPKFIYVSTSHVFEPTLEPVNLTPAHTPSPNSVYGKTKHEGELRLLELSDRYPETQVLVCRVFSLLSGMMRPGFLYSEIHRRVRENDFSPIPGLRNYRDFIFADDVCRRIVSIAKILKTDLNRTDSSPRVFHICTGTATSVRNIVETVFRHFSVSTDQIVESSSTANSPANYLIGHPTLLENESFLEFPSVAHKLQEVYLGRNA